MSSDVEESRVRKNHQEAETHCREENDEKKRLRDRWSHVSC